MSLSIEKKIYLGKAARGGGTTPTGTINITSNGTHDVTDYATANVNVPTTAPDYYIEKIKDANNKLNNPSTVMDLTGVSDVGDYVLYYSYAQNTNLTGAITLKLTGAKGQYACSQMFNGCTGITSADLSSLQSIEGAHAFEQTFDTCTGLISADLSGLKSVTQQSGCASMFNGCTAMTSLDLSSIETISGSYGSYRLCYGCSALTSINLNSLIVVGGNNGLADAFSGCSNLATATLDSFIWAKGINACQGAFYNTKIATITFPKLCIIANGAFNQAFRNATSLTYVSFPGLAYTATNFNGAFSNMLQGVTGCTVHFPAEWQTPMSSWSTITNGMGGTNTTVLFDLPNVTTLDLSPVKTVNQPSLFQNFARDNYFPNITAVNLSGLISADASSACDSMFYGSTSIASIDLSSLETINGYGALSSLCNGCTALTTVNLSSLREINGSYALQMAFKGCTSLTSLSFPALETVANNNAFSGMLDNVTGCTVHFPSNLSSYNFNVGGTNTVLYDLPPTA